ncbi:MAG: hypothetical protein QXU98_03225 [Candidatus Parvarchaeota archaeon]
MKPSLKLILLALSMLIILMAAGSAHAQTASINVTDSVNQSSNVYAENTVNYSIILNGVSGNFSVPIPANSYDISASLNGSHIKFSYVSTANYLMLKFTGLSSGDRLDLLFTYDQSVNVNDSYYMDTYYFIPPAFTSYFRLEMLLPLGAYAVSTNKVNSYEPSVYGFFTNGRRIEAEWILENQTFTPNLYVIIPFYLGYKLTLPAAAQASNLYILYIAVAIAVAVFTAIALFLLKRRRNKPAASKAKKTKSNPFRILLSEEEKKILNMIPRDKFIMQKEIVEASSYSKAKVSKIISKLSRYRFIKIIPEGRNNKLKRN